MLSYSIIPNKSNYFISLAGNTASRGEFERLSVQPGEGQYTTVSLTSSSARRSRPEDRFVFVLLCVV